MSFDAGHEEGALLPSSHRITWFAVERPVGGTVYVKPVVEHESESESREGGQDV